LEKNHKIINSIPRLLYATGLIL